MPTTDSESIVSQINSNVFFKEFTFSKNNFKAPDTNKKLEFADNVVWLDDLLFIYQIKEREPNSKKDSKRWFNRKVLKKATEQIKSTLSYISSYPEIFIENEKGDKLDIKKATPCNDIKKIIIYAPLDNFPESQRYIKFYESSEIGLVHLFHVEDYFLICKYLITPAEIKEYLDFRERQFHSDKEKSNTYSEQHSLERFLEALDTDYSSIIHADNLTNYESDINIHELEISHFIKIFRERITSPTNYETEYYPIVKEIAKLNRNELIEFKKRMLLTKERVKSQEADSPYRMYVPRTNCAFIFMMSPSSKSEHRENALHNNTTYHEYDCKPKKCIGVLIYREKDHLEYFEARWLYSEPKWQYNEEIEETLRNRSPLRKMEIKIR